MLDAPHSRIADVVEETDATTAAARIPPDATVLTSGFGSVGYPKAVPLALADSDRELSLTIISGGSVGDEIDRKLTETNGIARRFPYQARPEMRDRINNNEIAFHDRNISQLGDEVRYGSLCEANVAVIEAIAVGNDWLIPSTSIGHTPTFIDAADELIVEVNDTQPLSLQALHDCYLQGTPPNREPIPLKTATDRIGNPEIHFDSKKLIAVVRSSTRDSPYAFRDPTARDLTIAENLAGFLSAAVETSPMYDDTVHIQFGVGSLGNALMSALGDIDFGDRTLVYYGEVIQDGLLDMVDSGIIDTASATSLALSAEGQDRLFSNMETYAKSFVLRPADISNSPTMIDRLGVIAVNSALEVDIYGHVNSTHLNGRQLMNGIGGSADYTRHSPCAIIALPSIAADGDISRIVPMVPHVDHTEHDVAVIVTEQGVADLRRKSPLERADELIENCAHPSYRDELRNYLESADTGGHIHHNLEEAFSFHDSR